MKFYSFILDRYIQNKRVLNTMESTRLDLMWDPNKMREKEMKNLNDILMSMLEYMEVRFQYLKEIIFIKFKIEVMN